MLKFKLFYLTWFLLFLGCPISYTLENNNTTQEDFVPSNEWQIVKPGQKIPPGLHIRSNLQTGITEAKILEERVDDNGVSGMILVNETDKDVSKTYTKEQLKTMLKSLKYDSHNAGEETGKMEFNRTKFRSYEQLKEELSSVQANFKTDLEIMRELISELQTDIDKDRQAVILQDLEYYLHQIDNGLNFVDMGGLAILHRYIDGNDQILKSEAFRCLSSALQGNSKAKVEAMKNGTLPRLLIQLQLSRDNTMVSRILGVISTITRQFPIAQIAFVNGKGMPLIGEIFDRYSALDDIKIPLKIFTLISDWLRDRKIDVDISGRSEDIAERQKQFQKIDIEAILLRGNWCERLGHLLSTRSHLSIDHYEKIIHSIVILYPVCRSNTDPNQILSFLDRANSTIANIASSSSDLDDFYFADMVKLIEQATGLVRSDIPAKEL